MTTLAPPAVAALPDEVVSCRAAQSGVSRPLRRTAERLMVEYADELSPGQVLAVLVRVDRALRAVPDLDQAARAAVSESAVRVAVAVRRG